MIRIEKLVDELQRRNLKPKLTGNEWYAKCPVHEGKHFDTFSFRVGEGETLLGYCHSCDARLPDILAALELDNETQPPQAGHVKEWVYDSADNTPLFIVVKSLDENGEKFYRQKQPDGTWNLKGIDRVLYKLPELIKSSQETVYLCEGEQNALDLLSLRLSATSISGGALKNGKRWLKEYTERLIGKSVVILQDNDESGKVHCEIVKEILTQAKVKCKILLLPDLKIKGDVSNWLESGGTKKDLEKITLDLFAGNLRYISGTQLLALNLPERENILKPIIKERDIGMISSWRGKGKSQIGFSLAAALATCTKWINWTPAKPSNVVYLDGEMSLNECYQRWVRWLVKTKEPLIAEFALINQELQVAGISKLSTTKGQDDLLEVAEKIKAQNDFQNVIIIDNISCLVDGDENSSKDWDQMNTFLIRLRALGFTVIMFHHLGKGGLQRGTSKREDPLDWSITMEAPEKKAECEFTLRWDKARGISSSEVTPVKVKLGSDSVGFYWDIVQQGDSLNEKIKKLKEVGKSGKEIASELGCSEATVSRVK